MLAQVCRSKDVWFVLSHYPCSLHVYLAMQKENTSSKRHKVQLPKVTCRLGQSVKGKKTPKETDHKAVYY